MEKELLAACKRALRELTAHCREVMGMEPEDTVFGELVAELDAVVKKAEQGDGQ